MARVSNNRKERKVARKAGNKAIPLRQTNSEFNSEPRAGFKPEPLVAKTPRQAEYMKAINVSDQVVGIGSAGTGKTFIAASIAADAVREGLYKRIILTRPLVAAGGEDPGALPGGVEDKVAPWVIPLTEVLEKRLGRALFSSMLKDKRIEIAPLGMLRGRTFDDAFVLGDEMQNASLPLFRMLLTRIGERSKLILNGDVSQTDLGHSSGLPVILSMIKRQNLLVPVVEFTEDDVVRSEVCAMWAKAFRNYDKGINP